MELRLTRSKGRTFSKGSLVVHGILMTMQWRNKNFREKSHLVSLCCWELKGEAFCGLHNYVLTKKVVGKILQPPKPQANFIPQNVSI